MPESESQEMKEEQTVVARPRNSGPKTIAVIALVVAVVSLLLNAYLIGAVQSSDNTIRDLQSDVSDLDGTVGDLESQISDLENVIDDLQTQVSDLEQTVADLEQRVSDLENESQNGQDAPTVDMVTTPISDGYMLEIVAPSRSENLDAYKITVVKDSTPWAGFPKIVVNGAIGIGPAGEYLNYTDMTVDGKLTAGDFFRLENPEWGSTYEVILIWAADDSLITSETIYCTAPTVEMVVTPTVDGYELEIAGPSRQEALSAYKVSVLKDGTPWGASVVVKQGDCGNGPANEELNFTDLTSDGMLTGGDFFTLENLDSGTTYEVILIWAADGSKITSETINTP